MFVGEEALTSRSSPARQAWNKGQTVAAAIRLKISQSQQARWRNNPGVREAVQAKLKGKVPWNKGRKLSEETRQKMREAKLNSTHSRRVRNKMSRAHTGKQHTPETAALLSDRLSGVPKSDAHKEKIAAAQRRRHAAARILRAVEAVHMESSAEAGGSDDGRLPGHAFGTGGPGSAGAARLTRAQVLSGYKAQLREYRALQEELSPWTAAFKAQHDRKPRLSDVECTGIPWLINRYKRYVVLRERLLNDTHILRDKLTGARPDAAAPTMGANGAAMRPLQLEKLNANGSASGRGEANGMSSSGRNREGGDSPGEAMAEFRPLDGVPYTAPPRVRSAMAAAIEYRQKKATETAAAASTAASKAAARPVKARRVRAKGAATILTGKAFESTHAASAEPGAASDMKGSAEPSDGTAATSKPGPTVPVEDEYSEVEMGEVRLVDNDDEFYHGSQHQQHVSSVLAHPFYGKKRRRDRLYECWTLYPSPAFNFSAAAMTIVSLVLLAALLTSQHGRDRDDGRAALPAPASKPPAAGQPDAEGGGGAVLAGDAGVAPEGSIQADFALHNDYRGRPRQVTAKQGLVAADHGRCSDTGLQILQQGGNAVDAAIATALCQGVMSPQASGVGGGTFMLIRSPGGSVEVIDAREVAPAAATERMFAGQPDAALTGGLAIGVPLELAGLSLAHQRHGSLPWADLVAPAATLARDGFPLHPYLQATLVASRDALMQYPDLRQIFLKPEGASWRVPQVGEVCCQRPRLARFLDDVASQGVGVLYSGKYTQGLVDDIRAAGGIVTAEDLHSAAATVKTPLQAQIWGLNVIGPPPPSSAAAVMTALQILAGYAAPFASSGALGDHHLAEAMKHAFALRMNLGDPGSNTTFLQLDSLLADMLSPQFAATLRSSILDSRTQNYTAYGGAHHVQSSVRDDHGTSHLNVVDRRQGAVAMTTTINTGFGSLVLSPSTGILLNNQMDDFSTPDQPNVYGLPPSAANFIRPGKKPLSSMSPIMLTGPDGSLMAAVGASGGPRIISAVIQAISRVAALGWDPLAAVAGARLHHQLIPQQLAAENWTAGALSLQYGAARLEALQRRGHDVTATDWGAVTQMITVSSEDSSLTGACDPRKDGAPAGY
ncbi:hypothetical protein WJX72_000222 [[Myrmecia] bisecta]|uniref:Glutathione hydrolase n=1 Tax=[Myrmecia] bisecta TaxID=41462 RepID=A0AAW1QDZ6_9CHLO